MRRPTVLATGLLVLVLAGGAVGCSSDDDGADGGDDEAATSTTATVPATTSSTSTTLPPAPALPTAPQATGEDAVDVLLDAWRAGDRATALTVATTAAVDALFAVVPESGQARGCNVPGANAHVSCVYRLDVGELQVRAVPTTSLPGGEASTGFVVDFVILGS